MRKRQSILVSEQWLIEQGACEDGKAWFMGQKTRSLRGVITKLIAQSQFNWANWTVVRFMTHTQKVQYACLAALESLKNFETLYPEDKRPRQAIQAALKWTIDSTQENQSAAWSAESAARSAAESAAESAARSAGSAAGSAAWSAAESAARSAGSAARSAARSAAESAAWSARSAAESAAESAARSAGSAARSAAWSAAESAAWSAAESAAWSAAWKKTLYYGLKIVFKESIRHLFKSL